VTSRDSPIMPMYANEPGCFFSSKMMDKKKKK